jgi:hypothetical protein
MIDWYYHGPGEGRVGPLSAEELRRHFQERRIQRDTLLWHQGLREWQPLERLAVEIGIEQMHQDASKPPPLPTNAAVAPSSVTPPSVTRPTSRGKYSRAPLQQKLKDEIRRRASADVRFATIDGGCAFEVAINADGKPIDGKSLRYEGHPDGNGFAWECRGGDLPEPYRPSECRSDD